MLDHSTNADSFEAFLEKLKEYHEGHYSFEPGIIVMDNHRVHYAKKLRSSFGGFKVLFTPAYSAHLSGIEYYWSYLKNAVAKHLARLDYELDQLQFEAEVDYMCSKLNLELDGRNIFMGARAELLKALSLELPIEQGN